jgi:hypothetical protein
MANHIVVMFGTFVADMQRKHAHALKRVIRGGFSSPTRYAAHVRSHVACTASSIPVHVVEEHGRRRRHLCCVPRSRGMGLMRSPFSWFFVWCGFAIAAER